MKQYLALRASAGSGKTFALALRYVYLLCKGAKPYEILTLTFTNKASNEMRHRISQSLATLAKDAQEGILARNDFFIALQKEGISEAFVREHIARIYAEFTQSHTRITTLDSFFYTILQKFCWYVGVGSDFEIGRYPHEEVYERFLDSLSPSELRDFARFCYQYFGTSQKITEFLRILWRYEELEEVFARFAPKAHLEELEGIIESKVASLRERITSMEGIAQKGINAFNYESIESLAEATWVLKGSEYLFFKKLKLQHLDSEFAQLRELLEAYLRGKESEIFARVSRYIERFKAIKSAYLAKTNTLNYNDITYKVLELLYSHHDRAFFYFRLDDKIMHILLDEFQDTSIVQYQILLPLIEEILSGSGRIEDRSVFMVGDTKQSIYGFRGGFSAVFEEMARRLECDELGYNYRSSKVVLEFVNEVFGAQYGSGYIPQRLSPKNENSQGYVAVRYAQKSEQQADEMCKIVYENVCELLENGAKPDDITILAFTNDEVKTLRDFIKFHNPKLPLIAEVSQNFFDAFPCNVLINALYYAHTQKELYKRNIAKLLGKELFWEPPLPAYSGHCARYVYEVIESLQLGCAAAMQFLEQACAYESIEEFLQVDGLIDVNAPKESAYGIRIMTIHKSKGLEFRHLIVCDCLKDKINSSKDKILYEYEGIELRSVYYAYKGRENVDRAYGAAKEAREYLEEAESLNRLYVAFTRAKQSLMIVCKPIEPKNEKSKSKTQSSYFERLELGACVRGALGSGIAHNAPSQSKENLKTPFTPLPVLGRQGDFMRVEQTGWQQEFSLESVMFGKALHSYFEYLLGVAMRGDSGADLARDEQLLSAYRESSSWRDHLDEVAAIVRNLYGFVLSKEALERVQARFMQAIANAEFGALCRACEIHTEVSYLHNGRFFRIDALLQNDSELIVLDYKSSHLPREEHFTQVGEYVKFLRKLSGSPTRGYLIYPASAQMCVALEEGGAENLK